MTLRQTGEVAGVDTEKRAIGDRQAFGRARINEASLLPSLAYGRNNPTDPSPPRKTATAWRRFRLLRRPTTALRPLSGARWHGLDRWCTVSRVGLVKLMFGPVVFPRQVGGLVAAGCLVAALISVGSDAGTAIVLAAAWTLGSLIGANAGRIAIVATTRSWSPPRPVGWRSVVIGGLVGLMLAHAITGDRVTTIDVLGAAAAPLAVFYAFAKLGCLRHRCCAWPAGARREMVPALQALEASASSIVAAISGFALVIAGPSLALFVFAIGHCTQRLASILIRVGPRRATFSLEAGVLVVIAGTVIGG